MSPVAVDPRPQETRAAAGISLRRAPIAASLGSRLSPRVRRVSRYLVTSGISTVVSEVTLLTLLGLRMASAVPASVTATVVGGLVSYLLSRYWIWPEANRNRPGRQLAEYWAVTVAGLLLSAAVTGAVEAHATGSHPLRVAEVGAAYLATYGLLWAAKFTVYQRLIFRSERVAAGG